MLAASSALTSSSASSDKIHSQLALSSDEFFCSANPFQGSTNTLAPYDRAMDAVLSVLPESTTMISPAMSLTLSSVRPILASSLRVMMQTERLMRERITGSAACARAQPVERAEGIRYRWTPDVVPWLACGIHENTGIKGLHINYSSSRLTNYHSRHDKNGKPQARKARTANYGGAVGSWAGLHSGDPGSLSWKKQACLHHHSNNGLSPGRKEGGAPRQEGGQFSHF